MKFSLGSAVRQIAVFTSVAALSVGAAAQGVGGVVESQGLVLGQASNSSSTSNSGAVAPNSDALSLLLDQNRQLQAEIQALRGLVEEQGFEIRRLQRDSLNRYTNIDERLTSLEMNGSGSASAGVGTTPRMPIPDSGSSSNIPGTASSPNESPLDRSSNTPLAREPASIPEPSRNTNRPTLEPAVLSEQQLYQMAYDSVINSNFERSIAEFDQYLSIYANGRFVTNAHYWKGQAYMYLNRYEEARASYEIILEQFPDSAKVPDAMYGLGLVYQSMGNISQARQILNDIKRRFPNTGAANLADTRLLSLD